MIAAGRSVRVGILAGLIGGILNIQSSIAEQLRLVIAASSPTPAGIAEKAKQLSVRFKDGLVIQTSDCGDARNVFAFASGLEESREAAQSALASTRSAIPDAYVRVCRVKAGSLLAFRVPAVDSSIADVPGDAVNWSDEDRVSSAEPLPDGRSLIFIRYYVKADNDPLEGRRERVVLGEGRGRTMVLEEQCARAGKVAAAGERIAFECATEEAGDQLMHTVMAFDESGHKLKETPHCRNPRWDTKNVLGCEAESVGADGRLRLERTRAEVP
jgi:hypothetical protein